MKPITIIGGGLAGLTLGILLRREGIPATILEAGDYPRHRVCGEFISGNGLKVLGGLGLVDELRSAGATEARNAAFFVGGNHSRFDLPQSAFCISRYKLDALLAGQFARIGGNLETNIRSFADGEGIVHATGRRRSNSGNGHLFGLKAHARGVPLRADLEMHLGPNRYVGICRCENGLINVCGLFHTDEPASGLSANWRQWLTVSDEFANLQWIEDSLCSVAALRLNEQVMPPANFSIGDTAAMIPPFTGNGMSMAFESATLSLGPLARFASSKADWSQSLSEYQGHWKTRFSNRLRCGAWLQRLLFHPRGQSLLLAATRLFPSLRQTFFRVTR